MFLELPLFQLITSWCVPGLTAFTGEAICRHLTSACLEGKKGLHVVTAYITKPPAVEMLHEAENNKSKFIYIIAYL
jgi:hypothetical protein